MESTLEVNNLVKRFGKTSAVQDVSFALHPGEIVGLIGPNGAGKTTTIKCILGLLNKTGGAVRVIGQDHLTEVARAQLAYIPETPELYPLLTVWEHLRFIALAYRLSGWEAEAERLIARFDLTDKRDALAKDLSKGMRQKVSICCALIRNPQVFLVDEPMVGLDPRAIRELKDIMVYLRQAGKTVLLSTHLLDIAESLCDEVLVLNKGQVIFSGSLPLLKERLKAGADSSLEELFLEVTGNDAQPAV